jgi:hypothetical protein
MKSTRKIAKAVLVAAAVCLAPVVLVVLLELTARLTVGRPAHVLGASWRLNHVYEPNSRIVADDFARSNPDFPEPYTCEFNAQGWRETRNVPLRKPKGTYRIFYVGDSFTEGTCQQDQAVPAIIGKRIADASRDKNLRIEVINAGSRSYSPILYYILIRYRLCAYRPDLVIVSVDMTDDADDRGYLRQALIDKAGDPWAVPTNRDFGIRPAPLEQHGPFPATPLAKAECFLYEYSSLYNVVRNAVRAGIESPQPGSLLKASNNTAAVPENGPQHQLYGRFQWCHEPWDSVTTAQVAVTMDCIRRICVLCQSKHIKLMLTSVPHYEQYNGDASGKGEPVFSARPHAEIAALARRMGVPYHNAFEDLRPLITGTPQTQYYYAGDIHLNPRGYHIWADAQYKFLSDSSNHLLPAGFY